MLGVLGSSQGHGNSLGVEHINPELHTIPYGFDPARVETVAKYVVGYCLPVGCGGFTGAAIS